MLGATVPASTALTLAAPSECAAPAWSTETSLPSSGAYSFAHTPKTRPSGALSLTKNPQVTQLAGAELASGESGPCSLVYHRSAASSRPVADRTLAGLSKPGVRSRSPGADLRLVRLRLPVAR